VTGVTDRAAARLTAALTRRLADAGCATPADLARELVHLLRGHGWRPVEALQPPVEPTDGAAGSRVPEEVRELRATLERRPPCRCGAGVLEHELVCGRREACPATGCAAYTPIPERN
jgi:hypothetical protein